MPFSSMPIPSSTISLPIRLGVPHAPIAVYLFAFLQKSQSRERYGEPGRRRPEFTSVSYTPTPVADAPGSPRALAIRNCNSLGRDVHLLGLARASRQILHFLP